jgi:hypothetical protein
MRVAVGLFGIHYVGNLNHWMGWKHGVDYRETLHNQFTHIYSKHDTKYYSATYYSDIQTELLDDYNFTSITFSEIDNSSETNQWVKRSKAFKNTIKLILEDKSDWDLAILTRYDLHFKESFHSLEIDFDKVNFLCGARWAEDSDLVDDNFYCVPRHLLKSFYDTIETIPETISSHQYHKWFDDYNLMIPGHWYSHEIPMYYINRIPLTNKTD